MPTIYLTHSTAWDYKTQLYQPLRQSHLNSFYHFILPHEHNPQPQNSKTIIEAADLILAEVSYPSTGQGIELGWANLMQKPILCFFQAGKNHSAALSILTDHFFCYANSAEFTEKLAIFLKNCKFISDA